jgi:hypothetical protein
MKYQDKTAADDKSIAFDFQFYYFLYRLLQMKKGESVGFEVNDDVHTELSNNRQVFVQLKHTVKTKADGNPVNLSCLDKDLWKTLYNWSQVITDSTSGREDISEQIKFTQKTDFLLSSNKTDNAGNSLLINIRKFKDNEINQEGLKKIISALEEKTTDKDIKKYIKKVNSLPEDVFESFIKNIDFELELNDIITLCISTIEEKFYIRKHAEQIFRNLDSQLHQDNYYTIKERGKVIISYEDFFKKYRRFFDEVRSDKLQVISAISAIPDCLTQQTFIKQLIEIGDIDTDSDDIMRYTMEKIKCVDNIARWHQDGDITQKDIEKFAEEAVNRWRIIFKQTHKKTGCEKEKANNVVDEVRREKLKIIGQELDTDLSNGEFYELSDYPKIGWHKDWEQMYKENKK